MKDGHDAGNGGNGLYDFFDESEAFDGERKRVRRDSELTPSNLTLYKFREPILNFGEERDLLREAQAGDPRAKRKLTESFHRLVLSIASEFHGPSRDDLIGAGNLGLSEAIDLFDLKRNTGRLSSLAKHTIRNAIRAEVKRFRKRGQDGETRIDRWLYSHPAATAFDIIEHFGCSKQKAEAALVLRDGYWGGHEHYDAAERGRDEDDEDSRRAVVAVDVPPVEVHAAGGTVTDDDWTAIVMCRARSAPRLKPILRAQYQTDQAAAHRVGQAQAGLARIIDGQQSRVHASEPRRSRIERENLFRYGLQRLADETDRRALRRLKQIGRPAYALELVERDRARIEARADPQQYLYPWVRESALSHSRTKQIKLVSKRRHVPKRSENGVSRNSNEYQIRVWRSPELEAA